MNRSFGSSVRDAANGVRYKLHKIWEWPRDRNTFYFASAFAIQVFVHFLLTLQAFGVSLAGGELQWFEIAVFDALAAAFIAAKRIKKSKECREDPWCDRYPGGAIAVLSAVHAALLFVLQRAGFPVFPQALVHLHALGLCVLFGVSKAPDILAIMNLGKK